jgi:hypothetical protein
MPEIHESRVNLEHLLEDIRDSYPFPQEEAIITELIANALARLLPFSRGVRQPVQAQRVGCDESVPGVLKRSPPGSPFQKSIPPTTTAAPP